MTKTEPSESSRISWSNTKLIKRKSWTWTCWHRMRKILKRRIAQHRLKEWVWTSSCFIWVWNYFDFLSILAASNVNGSGQFNKVTSDEFSKLRNFPNDNLHLSLLWTIFKITGRVWAFPFISRNSYRSFLTCLPVAFLTIISTLTLLWTKELLT